MAAKKSKQNPYRWSNGTWHSRPERTRNIPVTKAPPGTYDIGLDMQRRAARRGLGDVLEDVGRQGTRSYSDWGLEGEDIERQRAEFLEDLKVRRGEVEQSYGRTLSDLLSQEQGVQRSYQRLGGAQRQNFQARGLQEGGAGEQAKAKRAFNEQLDIAPINVARTRAAENRQASLDDLLRQETRTSGEEGSINRALGQSNLGYQRGVEDRTVTGRRAEREYNRFVGDIGQTKMQQYLEGGGSPNIRVTRRRYRQLKKQGVI